jgi:ABC-2 type transport system permease protein
VSRLSKFIVLVKREAWEYQGAFFLTPAIIALLLVLLGVVLPGWYFGLDKINALSVSGSNEITAETSQHFVSYLFQGISIPFTLVLYFVIIYYLLGCLFDDRKDRSILFWRSLPVSETQAVLAKIVAAALVAPVIAFIITVAVQLIFLLIGSVYLWIKGVNLDISLWLPGTWASSWLDWWENYGLRLMWSAPFFAWLLLVSSYVRKSPFLWAFIPPFLLALLELLFHGSSHLFKLFGSRLLPYDIASAGLENIHRLSQQGQLIEPVSLLQLVKDSAVWWGLGVAVIFTVGAILLRRYRIEL